MKFLKNNWFFFTMIIGIVLGIIVGFVFILLGIAAKRKK